MHFVGHTRFSIFEPNSSSWRLSRSLGFKTAKSYQDILFNKDRLNPRVDIFFQHTLPTIDIAKANHNLIHIISYSEELPDQYQNMLEEAAKKYSWIRLDKRTPKDRKGTSLNTFVKKTFSKGTIYGLYRLDDDDVLASNFFECAAPYLNESYRGMIVSLGFGIQAFYSNGDFFNPRFEHRPKIAIGLMKVCEYTANGKFVSPVNVAHPQSDRKNPVILDSREVTFLHSMHLAQDSGVDKPEGDLHNRYRHYFRSPKINLENEELTKLFPTILFAHDAISIHSPQPQTFGFMMRIPLLKRVLPASKEFFYHKYPMKYRSSVIQKIGNILQRFQT